MVCVDFKVQKRKSRVPLVRHYRTINTVFINSIIKMTMPRKTDIRFAFTLAVQKNPKGYQCLRTDDFIRDLGKLNWHLSWTDANEWIKHYQSDFIDKTPDFSENRLWMLHGMGRVN